MSVENHQKNRYLHKYIINESSKAAFKRRLRETSWDAVKGLDNLNEPYVKFMETIMQIYDDYFPKTKFKIKSNNKANPWITKGIAKSSKRKQKLYEKFLKNRSIQNEKIYKDYRKLFETITMKSKRKYYSEKLLQFQGDTKKTWLIMKEVIGKYKLIHSTLPCKTVLK